MGMGEEADIRSGGFIPDMRRRNDECVPGQWFGGEESSTCVTRCDMHPV